MANEIAPQTTFTVPNREGLAKASGTIFKLAVIGAIGFAAYVFLLPFLVAVVWGTVELAIGIPLALGLIYLLSQKKLWRAIGYYSQWVAEKLLGMAIEMNRWQILYDWVDGKSAELENVKKQNIILRGYQATTFKAISENNKTMEESAEEVTILRNKIKNAKTQDEADDLTNQLETVSNDFTNSKGFIDDVQQTLNGLNTLVTITDKQYKKGTTTINNLKSTIKNLKLRFDITSAGSKAMESAQAALTGNPSMQSDANRAYDSISKQIGQQMGAITQGIQLTTQVMNGMDLKDAAKVQLAAKTIDQFNTDAQFQYSDTIKNTDTPGIPQQTQGNKFLDLLK